MPTASDCVLRATRPMRSPVTMPFTVDPMTMPTIWGAVSGADRSAVRPSKMPRKPPSRRPKTGLLISFHLRRRISPAPSLYASAPVPLDPGHHGQDDPHHEVGGHEQDRRPVL